MKQFFAKIFGQETYLALARKRHQCTIFFHNLLHPYHFNPQRYSGTFMANDYPNGEDKLEQVEKVIYIFWTGDNEITPNRLAGIKSLEEVSGVRVQLITPQNLSEYIVEEDPLPDAYQYLSLNHKSDYLRSYFMHHHGGGYADIKTYFKSWNQAFDRLNTSDAYAVGYHEVGWWGAAWKDIENENLREDVKNNWAMLIGNGAFICRPHTKLTEEWHAEAKRRVETLSEELKAHPAKDIFGTNEDYPIKWSGMQGSIFHPLCLKYHDRLLMDNNLKPSFENYR